MDNFCGTVFWDEYQTWNTSNPDFTPCFQKTVLVWIPSGILWLFLPLQIRYIGRHPFRLIQWTGLNVMKTFSSLILIVCSLTRLMYMAIGSVNPVFLVDFTYPVINTFSYVIILILVITHKRVGIHSSTLLIVFWLLQTLAGIITYRSLMLKVFAEDDITDIPNFIITVTEFPFTAAQFILSCFPDSVTYHKNESKNPYPEKYASPISHIFYNYFDTIAWKGFNRPLEVEDLWSLRDDFQSTVAFADYEQLTNQIQIKSQKVVPVALKSDEPPNPQAMKPPGLLKVTWKMVKWNFITAILVKYVGDLLSFVNPLMLQKLINFVTSDEPAWRGVLYAVVLFVCTCTAMVCQNFHFYRMQCIGIRVRAAVMSAVYRKALKMSSVSKRTSTVGEIVTLMSVDGQRVMDIWQFLGHAFSMPLQVGISMVLLWNLLGPSVLIGVAIILLFIPINGYIANLTSKVQVKLMKQKDQRTKLMNEVLGGMKLLKLYAWEIPFFGEINKVRTAELSSLKKLLLLQAITTFLFQCAPFMISLSSFATYVLSDASHILDASTAFVSLSLFDIIRIPLGLVPIVIATVVQAMVSVRRLDKFFANEDLDPDCVTHTAEVNDPVVIKDATLSWGDENMPILKDINLSVSDGQLVAVVGSVGAGKSSLISCLLGEMEKITGFVNTKGSIAYVAQQAWIQNATLRDNILFGRLANYRRYESVVEACALKPDLEILPAGDQTEIGEKGINLSGGQKQRVSLARAVYRDCDVYLLDDPLSAVDAHVGKHIFEQVIGPKGLLKAKTRILVTHGIAYLPYVDSIVVLVNGSISEVGSYKDLLQEGGAFAEFIMTYLNENEDIDEIEAAELMEIQEGLLQEIANEGVKRRLSHRISRTLSSDDESVATSPQPRKRHLDRTESTTSSQKKFETPRTNGKLTQIEQMEVGKVDWDVYIYYFKAIGKFLSITMILTIGLGWTSSVSSNIWLSIWSNDQPLPDGTQDTALRDIRLGVYGAFGFGQAIFALGGSLALAWGSLRASKRLHNYMLLNVLHCPMSFFETTPLGRIVNRFSRDVDVTDIFIPTFLRPVLDGFFQMIGTVVVISLGTPYFLIAFLPLGSIYYFVQRLYIDSNRQLKRMESVSRSPIYSHFSETISGLSTIRAYQVQDEFIHILEEKIDDNHILFYPILTAKRWLGIRLEGIGDLVVLFASLFAALSRESLDPGSVGLSISYSLSVTWTLMWMVRNWTDLESNIVSVERMKEYSELENEAPWEVESPKPRASWPENGNVQFSNYCLRYRKELELVLNNITCDINSGEKVGIVGRTGAGKSSLTLALFRIIEAAEGTIKIDGEDISQLGLHDLRSRLTIIPQDPILFCGTLRLNLDPFNKYEDSSVWRALEHSHLKNFVSTLSGGLDHEVTEGGENLSVGQRQLVCLARALLRKTKVLVMDEATAAVDLETDDLIQATIHKEFAKCTVLTIAHRLNTVLESDKVMVLDQGKIKEFNTPRKLLEDKHSVFYSMAKDAGLV